MNWHRAHERDQVRPEPLSVRGIIGRGQAPTPKQLAYVQALAEQAGEPAPVALTRAQTGREIDRLKRKIAEAHRP
jgi:hypothetical protein